MSLVRQPPIGGDAQCFRIFMTSRSYLSDAVRDVDRTRSFLSFCIAR